MRIDVLLTELEIAQEFGEAVQARDIPEKFFYWSPIAVKAWLKLTADHAHSPIRDLWDAVTARAAAAVEHFPDRVPVISFGCGGGARDLMLVEALKNAGREVEYFPVDASQALLEAACAAAEDADLDTVVGIKADISSPVHLVYASDAAEAPKLLLLTGNTMAAFDPLDQIRNMRQCLHEGDRLIVDGEIYSDEVMARREGAAMHEFALAPLRALGLGPNDGEIRFEQKVDERHEGLYQIARYFRAAQDLHVIFGGQDILIERGERISMNFRYVYTPEAFRWLIEQRGGMNIEELIPGQDGRFVAAICSR